MQHYGNNPRHGEEQKTLNRRVRALRAAIAIAIAIGTSVTFEDAQDYDLTPNLDRFCQDHGLTCHRAWIARACMFEAGVKFRQAGMGSPIEEAADDGGEPMIILAALRNCHEAGQLFADVLARLEKARAAAVPPLTLIEAAGVPRQAAA